MNNTPHPLHRSACFLLLAASLAGCANHEATRLSWERPATTSQQDRFAYLHCVSSKVSSGPTYLSFSERSGELLVGSADPLLASGRVQVEENADGMHVSLYQTNAWQDRGGLVNAAQLCTNS